MWGDFEVILINKARIMNPRDAEWTVIVTKRIFVMMKRDGKNRAKEHKND